MIKEIIKKEWRKYGRLLVILVSIFYGFIPGLTFFIARTIALFLFGERHPDIQDNN